MLNETRVREVREAIHRAFGGLRIPQTKWLITCNCQSAVRFRELLRGRTWQSLSPEFLTDYWSSYCYLSPLAYRYYLPALLTGALDRILESGGLPHSVVFDLGGDFDTLYHTGEDRQFQRRQALLTAAQYEAVCSFLGLFLDKEDRCEHLAAQALRWRWTRIRTPAHEVANAYYHRLHTYEWPVPDDPQVAELCGEICAAFADTPYPGDDQLCGAHDREAAADAMDLRGLAWQTIHPELLEYCYTALVNLSDAGFRYYLPAFLIANLHEHPSNADPVFSLTYGLAPPERINVSDADFADLEAIMGKARLEFLGRVAMPPAERWVPKVSRFQAFTPSERKAIVRYLEYRSDDSFDGPRIHAALETYWRPSAG
jgi:hypothetical protein